MFKCSLYPQGSPTTGNARVRQLLPGRNMEMDQVQSFSMSNLEASFICDVIDATVK